MLARYGGDEFAVLLTSANTNDAQASADRIRTAIQHVNCDRFAPGLRVTVSGGFRMLPADLLAIGAVDDAHRFLYEAKRAGKNTIIVALEDEGRVRTSG